MKKLMILLLTSISISVLPAQQKADDILGIWSVDSQDAHIEISQEGGEYVGKIVWLQAPNTDKGEPKTDKKNPDKNLRGRSLMGMPMLTGLTYQDGSWEGGEIYSAQKGKTANCNLKLIGTDKLVVTAKVLRFTTTKEWTRVK
ncbi:MAG: DUF2147 domain-containing protein [Bacteroidota bacterium]